MGMLDAFKVPRDPHEGEPDELTPDTNPIDDIERPHGDEADPDARVTAARTGQREPPAKDLDEPGAGDRTPRP